MKIQLLKLTVTLSLAITSTVAIVNPIFAQITNEDNYQSNEKDGLYGDSTLGVDPMDLIHNYNLRVGRSADEFSEESGTQIEDSAAEFRRLQQERMLEKYNNTPENSNKVTE